MPTIASIVAFSMGVLVALGTHATPAPEPNHPSQVYPTDLALQLSAQPSAGLVPGQPIEFSVTLSNLGPTAIDLLTLLSSTFGDEVDINFASADCPDFFLWVSDEGPPFQFEFAWHAVASPSLEVGESVTCHFRFALSDRALPSWAFSFGLSPLDADINPDNNNSTVVLRRGDIAPVALPADAPLALLLIGMSLLVAVRNTFSRS